MVEGLQIAIAGLALGWTAVVVVFTILGQKEFKRRRDAGKTWLIELNGNNKTAKVQLVKPGHEGYQVPNGPFVKFEGDFTYIDRENNRPVTVYNGDTGFAIKVDSKDAESFQEDEETQKVLARVRAKYPSAALVKAKVGETEEMDGMIYAASQASGDIERVSRSHGQINWVAIALIGGLVVVCLVGIIFWGVAQFMKTQGQGA